VRFLIDSMLPPQTVELLNAAGHDAVNPSILGAHNLPDDVLTAIAAEQGRAIVTENAQDFAQAENCTVLFVRKSWWPAAGLAARLAQALDRWSKANPEPGHWPNWLPAQFR
jgi:hypothetical protein